MVTDFSTGFGVSSSEEQLKEKTASERTRAEIPPETYLFRESFWISQSTFLLC